jgi:Flp pilus assembly protein TadG
MRSFRRLLDAGRRAAAAFATRQDGGPSVEFVLVAPVFVVVIFATVQCAIIYFCNAGLETVTEEAARLVLTNQSTSLSAAQFQTAVCNKLPTFFTCSGIKVGLQAAPSNCSISTGAPAFNADGTLAASLPYQQPAPGQIGVLQVMYQWPVLGLPLGWNFANLGNGTYLMMSTQVFMVEQAQ